nr:ATP-binding protein [Streptomyces specialis]
MRERRPRIGRPTPLEPTPPATAPHFRSLVLPADAGDTGRVARRTAHEITRCWRLPVSADDLALCVSELVGNAVHHAMPDRSVSASGGRPQVVVSFRAWPRHLFVEVTDEDSTPPVLPVGEPLTCGSTETGGDDALLDHGRGLLLVRTLADAVWWSPRAGGGKSVCCRFDLSGGDT